MPLPSDHAARTYRQDLFQAVREGDAAGTRRLLDRVDGPGLPGGRWGRAWRRFRHRVTLNLTLQTAAEVNNVEAIDRLLPLANPHAIDAEGRTPFLLATLYGQVEAAGRLLPVSNPVRTGRSGVPPLVHAARHNMTDLIARLIPRYRTPQRSRWMNEALAMAAEWGRLGAVLLLLDHADPRAPGDQQKTPLMRAAEHGHLACVDALLPRSDANARDHQGKTALMHAATNGHPAVLERLVPYTRQAGTHTQIDGKTALHLAAIGVDLPSVAVLLPLSDPDQRDHDGWTPLMYAASTSTDNGHHKDVRVLERLLAVSNPHLRNPLDQNAFDLALGMALQWRRPWHLFHWDRVDVLMFHEKSAQARERAWQEGGPERLPRWALAEERRILRNELPTLTTGAVGRRRL